MKAMEKVTFNLPSDVKAQVIQLKNDLKLSMSSIYVDAIKSYIKQQEEKKWQKASNLAVHDEKYMKFVKEMDQAVDDVYEY